MHKRRFTVFLIDYFGITHPFAWCSGKQGFKKSIVQKQNREKEIAEIKILYMVLEHVPVAYFKCYIRNGKNKDCINQKIKNSGADANYFHAAKLVHHK